jgi:hypothetical protein
MMSWRRPRHLLSVAALVTGCHHGGLRQVAPSADAGAAPDAAGAELGAADAVFPPADRPSDAYGTDATADPACGSPRIGFHLEPDPSVDPTTLCTVECGGPLATLTSGGTQLRAGSWISLDVPVVWGSPSRPNGCVLGCDTCQPIFCHSCIVASSFPATGFDVVWYGTYYVQGTCNGNPCMGPTACAPTGHYGASFCIQRGLTVHGSLGPGGCLSLSKLDSSVTWPSACGSAEFDLPSTVSLSVKLGGPVGTRGSIDPGLAAALLDLVGSYRLNPSSGTIADETGIAKVQFSDADLAVASDANSDLTVITNPLPGDFPGSCTIPLNAVVDAAGDWSLTNPGTTCAVGGATVTLYPGYYTVTSSGRDLAVRAAGNSTGGIKSATETLAFAYSGTAVRSP